jgi:adhesin transport system membrane fusion protein
MTNFRKVPFIYVLLFFVLVCLAWAVYFEIDETVRARGKIIVEGRVQIIQAPEGGVMKSIEVREGDTVKAGQILATMEARAAQAAVDEVLSEIATNEIAKIRALAELEDKVPDFSAFAETYPAVIEAQIRLLKGNRSALEAELENVMRQKALADAQLARVRELHKSGDISYSELSKTEREVIQIEGTISEVREKWRLQARKEIVTIEQQLSSLAHRLAGRETIVDFSTLRAPQDGVVTLLRVNTLGGVMRAGDELMRISPTGDKNLIELQVAPADVGNLVIGQEVALQFDSFSSTIFGSLSGRLAYLGADTITETTPDGRSKAIFIARVTLDQVQSNARIRTSQLRPGMEVTADVKTGRRSVFVYLAKPILRAFSGALSER